MSQTQQEADAEVAAEAIDDVYRRYMDPIEKLLGKVIAELRDQGMRVSEVENMSVDYYLWEFYVGPDRRKGSIVVSFSMPEAHDYADPPPEGLSFAFGMHRYGGEALMLIQPYNYTEDCWVSAFDAVAVQRRWHEAKTQVETSLAVIADKILMASECRGCGENDLVCTRGARCCAECNHQADTALGGRH